MTEVQRSWCTIINRLHLKSGIEESNKCEEGNCKTNEELFGRLEKYWGPNGHLINQRHFSTGFDFISEVYKVLLNWSEAEVAPVIVWFGSFCSIPNEVSSTSSVNCRHKNGTTKILNSPIPNADLYVSPKVGVRSGIDGATAPIMQIGPD